MLCAGARPPKLIMLGFRDDVVRVVHGLVGPHLRLTITLWDVTTTPSICVGFHESRGFLRIHVCWVAPCSDFPSVVLVKMHPLWLSHSLLICARCMFEGLISPSLPSNHLQDSFKYGRDPTSSTGRVREGSWRK